jgi:hypothetical protein
VSFVYVKWHYSWWFKRGKMSGYNHCMVWMVWLRSHMFFSYYFIIIAIATTSQILQSHHQTSIMCSRHWCLYTFYNHLAGRVLMWLSCPAKSCSSMLSLHSLLTRLFGYFPFLALAWTSFSCNNSSGVPIRLLDCIPRNAMMSWHNWTPSCYIDTRKRKTTLCREALKSLKCIS